MIRMDSSKRGTSESPKAKRKDTSKPGPSGSPQRMDTSELSGFQMLIN